MEPFDLLTAWISDTPPLRWTVYSELAERFTPRFVPPVPVARVVRFEVDLPAGVDRVQPTTYVAVVEWFH